MRLETKNRKSQRVTVVPTIVSASANLVTIACPVCGGRQHTYLRSNALREQQCPVYPESGVALLIIPPDEEAASSIVADAA